MALNLQLNKNFLFIIIALVLGGGAVYLSNKVIRDRMNLLEEEAKRGKKMVKIVVPTKDLERGDVITPDAMAMRDVPQDFVSHLAVKPEQFDDLINQRLSSPIKRGEALTQMHTEGAGARLFSATLRKGLRALTFEVDQVNSISGMLRPGDRIDLVLTAKPANNVTGPEITFPMLLDVPVLATGQVVSKRDPRDGSTKDFSTITLEATPDDAQKIISAKNSSGSKLTAVLRNSDDKQRFMASPITINDVIAGRSDTGLKRTVEFIIGGGGQPTPVTLVAAAAQTNNALRNTAIKYQDVSNTKTPEPDASTSSKVTSSAPVPQSIAK
jgi:pilus assembly protein CpaB